MKEFHKVQINLMDLTHTMFIGVGLSDDIQERLLSFLIENRGSSVWSHSDMMGVNEEMIVH